MVLPSHMPHPQALLLLPQFLENVTVPYNLEPTKTHHPFSRGEQGQLRHAA